MDTIKTFLDQFGEFPIIAPLLALLRSRKFIVGAVTLLADILIAQNPDLEGSQEALQMGLTTLIGALLMNSIGTIDGVEKSTSIAPRSDVAPLLGPVAAILGDSKSLAWVGVMIVMVITSIFPELKEVSAELTTVIAAIVAMYIQASTNEMVAEKTGGIINPASLASFKIRDNLKASG